MQRYLVGLVLASLALVAAESPKKKAAKTDEEYLQGVWHVKDAKGLDKKTSKEEIDNLRLIIRSDKILARYGDKSVEASYKLDAVAVPRKIDVTVSSGPEQIKDKTFKGIYMLEGYVLRIAFREPGKDRPSSFDVSRQEGVHEILFERTRAAR